MNATGNVRRDAELPPLVSVAIITYNQLAFLKECMQSVLSQSYHNLEIIVADDSSSDGTVDWLKQLQVELGEKIKVVTSTSNLGITKNCNAARLICAGKYIAWMGGDDLMLEEKIETQVNYLEQNSDCAVCYHDLDVFESETGKTIRKFSDKNPPRQGGLREMIKYGSFNGACSTMVRASCTPPRGFDERLPIASDWLYWIETLASGGRVAYVPRILGRYRRHDGNVTSPDARSPKLANIQDHITACGIALSKWPEYASEVKYRLSELLISLRWNEDGARHSEFLRASMHFCVRPKAIFALIAEWVFFRKL